MNSSKSQQDFWETASKALYVYMHMYVAVVKKVFFPLSVAKQTLKKQKAEVDALISKLAEMETQISNKVLCKIKILFIY